MLSVSEEFGNSESAGIAERSVHDEASRCLQPGLGFVGNSLAPIQHKKTPAETSRRFNEGWLTGIEPATSGTTNQRSNRLSYSHHHVSVRRLTQRARNDISDTPHVQAAGISLVTKSWLSFQPSKKPLGFLHYCQVSLPFVCNDS